MSVESWARDIPAVIDKIIGLDPNEELAVVLAALLALRDRFAGEDVRRDAVPESDVDELLQDLLSAFVAYSHSKRTFQTNRAEADKTKMLKLLDSMLDKQRRIFTMLWREADIPEERERLRSFIKSYAERYKL